MNDQRRGKNLALAGTLLQAALAAAMLAIGIHTGAKAALACSWILAGGVAVWLMAALLFYCRQLERQEETELAELAERGDEGAIFSRQEDLSLRPARSRRQFVERWVVPIFTLLLAAYHAGMGVLVLLAVRRQFSLDSLPPISQTAAGLLFGAVGAFVGFLYSRYCTGMSSRAEWRPLRAPAAWLLLGAMLIGAAAVSFAAAWAGYRRVDLVIALAVPLLQFVLAAELAVGLILDIYRPRVPGQARRLCYDSRILGLLAEPAKVGHSIAETLNYQFGFEVSGTWFYRLLSKSLLPLVVFGAIVLVGMSSLVIVYEGQQAVVLHWGRPEGGKLLGPGLHVKWPWPVDTARNFDTAKVHRLLVGVGGESEPKIVKGRELRLWTDQHGRFEELDFLVAIPPDQNDRRDGAGKAGAQGAAEQGGDGGKPKPPPVQIIKLVVGVWYRIADPYKFGYRFADADKLLEGAAYREMVRYCASATIDTTVGDGATDRPEAIMTSGWGPASEALERRIRRAVGPEGLDLGVEIASVKLVAAHPPAAAAESFEAVMAAERNQDRLRHDAVGEAYRTLSQIAGAPASALELSLAVRRLQQLEESRDELRSNPAGLEQSLARRIRRTAENLATLLKEIRRERLRGQITTPAARRPGPLAEALAARLPTLDEPLRTLIAELLAEEELAGVARQTGTPYQRLAAGNVENLLELMQLRTGAEQFDFGAAIASAEDRAEALFDRATGEAAKRVAEAEGGRLTRQMGERGLVETFARALPAYRASPRLYMLDRWLELWDEILPSSMKYVLGVPRGRVELRMNWERQRKGLGAIFEEEGGPTE